MKMEKTAIEAMDISKEYKLRVGFMEEGGKRRKKSTNDMKIPALHIY